MTIKQVILIVLTISFLTSCRYGYKIENDNVYYEYWNEGSGQRKRLIEQADAKTFQKLDFDCNCSFDFGKDKNNLFINGEPIKNIDPNSFKFIGNYIFRDKDSAYFFGFYNNLNECVIKGINPNEIKLIEFPWARANNILIHGQDTVYLDDINDFIPIDEDWGKTKKYVINDNSIIYGADVETFKIINSFSGKDKDYNYEFGFIAKDEFIQTSYKNFDFDKIIFCKLEPTEFVDIYDKLEPFIDNQSEHILIVDKLKAKGFTIRNIRQSNSGESIIISVELTNNTCNCYIEKFYQYNYSKPSEIDSIFKITERIHCQTKKRN